jgi:hypothetical protein
MEGGRRKLKTKKEILLVASLHSCSIVKVALAHSRLSPAGQLPPVLVHPMPLSSPQFQCDNVKMTAPAVICAAS